MIDDATLVPLIVMRGDDGETQPIAESLLEAERFPACAELVLAQYVLSRGLHPGASGRTISKSGGPRPSV